MSGEVEKDRETLMASVLAFARHMLETNGEFYPFAALINHSGQMEQLGADTGDERPSSKEMIELLLNALRVWATDGKLRASAVAFDVSIQLRGHDGPSDAIAVLFDHVSGTSEQIYVSYRLASGKADFDEPVSQPNESAVFRR